MNTPTIPLAVLRFEGERFNEHSLDVDCVGELTSYKRLVLDCAKELWRRAHLDYERLPKGFDEHFVLRFSEVTAGSAVIPLHRVVTQQQQPLDYYDEFDQAAALIDDAITAADRDDLLPAELPRTVLPSFRDFGRTLRESETLYVQSRTRATPAPYTAQARRRLADWTEANYEDVVDVTGEVNMANVRGGAFELTLQPGQPPIRGKFSEAQEAEILAALQSHTTTRLRVTGLGEFSQTDRQLRKLLRVDQVVACAPAEPNYVEGVKPIWETLAELGTSIPKEAWDSVPSDLAKRLDNYLYSSNETE
jgi:hypothetical protein